MPNYKTHSIHGEVIFPDMSKEIEIDIEDLKSFCIGPDALITTDYKTFDRQHEDKVREYFESMLKIVKKNKLQDNAEAMAFIYGQLDHYILDMTIHPLIYYITEGMDSKHIFNPHGLIENWIDDYIIQKYDKEHLSYYHKLFLSNKKLKKAINKLYEKVYGSKNESFKYSLGILNTHLYDILIRRNLIGISPLLIKLFNVGNIMYDDDLERILPYLNLDKDNWQDPETGEKYDDSFDELWIKSIERSLETVDDINNYLYKDEPLRNKYITNDISFNTGIPCGEGQSFQYIKQYNTNTHNTK